MPCGGGEASVLGERKEMEMRKLAILTAFLAGYVVNDMVGEFAPVVHAEVAGMDRYELKSDWDFKRAVEYAEELKLFHNPNVYLSEQEVIEFLESYHNLEYFLYDCYYYFFCTYPKFIWLNETDRKFDLSYEIVFQSNNWDELRHQIIDFLVNKNGRESILKQLFFLSKFGIQSKLTSTQTDRIAVYSLCRNTLIHQEGIISMMLLRDLEKFGFTNPFEIDNHIIKDYQDFCSIG